MPHSQAAAHFALAWLLAALSAFVAVGAHAAERSLTLRGSHRTRAESLDPQFRSGFSGSDQALMLHTALALEWRTESLQVVGEVIDARVLGNDTGSLANTTTTNALEPVQAFVAWHRGGSTLRFGRVAQDFGKRRLLARSRYRNTITTFTGIDWAWRGAEGRSLHAFYWIPMRALPSDLPGVLDNDVELDRGTRDSTIAGLFLQLPAIADRHAVEAYLFDYELDAASDAANAADHVTLGTRIYHTPRPGSWGYEVEAALQRGESGGSVGGSARRDLEHRASFLHLEVGYAFDTPWEPVLAVQYDRATGDRDPTDLRNERFNTLFGARRFDFGPTGIYGIAARSNIESPGLRLTFHPKPKWLAMFAYRSLQLAAARDAWQGSGWRDATGAAGRSIGTQLEGSFTWTPVQDRLSVETGFAHLSAARFLEETAGSAFRGNPQYFYASITTTF